LELESKVLSTTCYFASAMSRLLMQKTVKANREKRAVRRRRQEIITSVKISRALYQQIQELAKEMDRTQSWIMREAVQAWVTYQIASKKVEPPCESP
jgi:Ribbon-helix-helix protein, copG family